MISGENFTTATHCFCPDGLFDVFFMAIFCFFAITILGRPQKQDNTNQLVFFIPLVPLNFTITKTRL